VAQKRPAEDKKPENDAKKQKVTTIEDDDEDCIVVSVAKGTVFEYDQNFFEKFQISKFNFFLCKMWPHKSFSQTMIFISF